MVVLRSRVGTILLALAMVASAAVAGALIGEVTGADAVVDSGEKPVMIDMNPTRALDTRPAPFGPIGVATAAPIGAKGVLDLTLGGVHGIPADATAVQLNITTINATAETFLTLYPAGSARPNASTMNPDVGTTQFNGAVIPLGAGGALSIYNHLGSVDVIIDVTGYFVDHNHDDRYYMKDASDAKYLESTPGVQLWSMHYSNGSGTAQSAVGTFESVSRLAAGRYRVTFSEPLGEDNNDRNHIVHVTPIATADRSCQWHYLGQIGLQIDVDCYDLAGNAADAFHSVSVYKISSSTVAAVEAPLTSDVSD